MFGVFVAYVKLGDLVHITLDAGVYALMALTVLVIWADSALDRELIWERVKGQDPAGHTTTSATGLASEAVGCEVCGLVNMSGPGERRCLRCDTVLHRRKPDSVARTWALVLAAAGPVCAGQLLSGSDGHATRGWIAKYIIGGVEELVSSGMYPLALLVFFASIAVPMLKLVGLTIMLVATQTGRSGWLRDRTKLYHVVRWIGRWSMIDIFMEALLGALVQFGNVITIEPGVGALAFCGVVILTMFAAETFDPRLMWDATDQRAAPIVAA